MEQDRWEGQKHARRRIITSACVGGKKGVKRDQMGAKTDKKVKKVEKSAQKRLTHLNISALEPLWR